jgi:hypothetical protein
MGLLERREPTTGSSPTESYRFLPEDRSTDREDQPQFLVSRCSTYVLDAGALLDHLIRFTALLLQRRQLTGYQLTELTAMLPCAHQLLRSTASSWLPARLRGKAVLLLGSREPRLVRDRK